MENQLDYILSVDTAAGSVSVRRLTEDLARMGQVGTAESDKLTAAVSRFIERNDSSINKARARGIDMIGQWEKTGTVISDTASKLGKWDTLLEESRKSTAGSDIGGLTNVTDNLFGNATKGAKQFAVEVDNAGKQTTRSLLSGQVAAQGLAGEFGLSLPRVVTRFLAQSETIGPILSAAFSSIAIVGMIEVLGQIPAAYEKITASITGWDEKSQKAYARVLSDNTKLLNQLNEHQAKMAGLTAVGGGDQARRDELAKRLKTAEDDNARLGGKSQTLDSQSAQLANAHVTPQAMRGEFVYTNVIEPYVDAIARLAGAGSMTAGGKSKSEIDKEKEPAKAEADAATSAVVKVRQEQVELEQQIRNSDVKTKVDLESQSAAAVLKIADTVAEGKAARLKAANAAYAASVKYQIGLEYNGASDTAKIDQDLLDEKYKALQKDFKTRRALADELGTVEGDAAIKQRADINSDEKQAALKYAADSKTVADKKNEAEVAARAASAEALKQIGLEQLGWERSFDEKEAANTAAMAKAQIHSGLSVEEAKLTAAMASTQRRMALDNDLVQHTGLTASQQVARKLALDQRALDEERKIIDETHQLKMKAIDDEIAAVQAQYDAIRVLGFEAEQQQIELNTLRGQRQLEDVHHGAAADDMRDRHKKAIEDAALATRDRQDAIVSGIAGNITTMFTNRLSNTNETFWQSFSKMGRDAIASVTKFFLDNLIKGMLDPFKGILDQMIQGLGASFRNLVFGGSRSSSLGSLAGGGGLINVGGFGSGVIRNAAGGGSSSAAGAGLFGGLAGKIGLGGLLGHGSAGAAGSIGVLSADGTSIVGGATGLTGALGLGGGAGLLGLGAATIPVIGGLAAAAFGLFELFKHHKKKYEMSPDPFAADRERTLWFNSTQPFETKSGPATQAYEQLNQTIGKLNGTVGLLHETVQSFDSIAPGDLVMKQKDGIKGVVAAGMADRGFRKAIANGVLEQNG
jgi:hypothetical protein